MHSLLHLTADATTYGSLDKCSAFSFESYLHQLKKTVRSGNHVLIQAAKRLQEQSQIPIETSEERPIHMKHPNNVYIVSPTSCCEVLQSTNSGKLLCRVLSYVEMEILDKTNLQGRAMILEDGHGHQVVLSLLHDLN